jgi:hypothetical protein
MYDKVPAEERAYLFTFRHHYTLSQLLAGLVPVHIIGSLILNSDVCKLGRASNNNGRGVTAYIPSGRNQTLTISKSVRTKEHLVFRLSARSHLISVCSFFLLLYPG